MQVYDNDATSGWVRRTYDAGYGVMFQDMGVGDFNADGSDDLVLVRNGDRQIRVMNVSPWTPIATESGINAIRLVRNRRWEHLHQHQHSW